MIWGQKRHEFRRVFAWRPVHLCDGRWAWMQFVWRIGMEADALGYRAPFSMFGSWQYTDRQPASVQP